MRWDCLAKGHMENIITMDIPFDIELLATLKRIKIGARFCHYFWDKLYLLIL